MKLLVISVKSSLFKKYFYCRELLWVTSLVLVMNAGKSISLIFASGAEKNIFSRYQIKAHIQIQILSWMQFSCKKFNWNIYCCRPGRECRIVAGQAYCFCTQNCPHHKKLVSSLWSQPVKLSTLQIEILFEQEFIYIFM